MLLWRVALGRAVWRAAFVHVGSAYWRTMIRGVFAVVKGGFSRIRRRIQDGGIPAYAGMTGGGTGHDVMGGNDGREPGTASDGRTGAG